MKSQPVRYGTRLGCRGGNPHDPVLLKETKAYKIEKCRLCGIRKRWNLSFKGRVNNVEYLRFHVRSFAQPNGSTKRVYNKVNNPNALKIQL